MTLKKEKKNPSSVLLFTISSAAVFRLRGLHVFVWFQWSSPRWLLQENVAEQKLKREAQVTLYRSYRQGDLPDIQIQHSSLIAPLQALAQVCIHCLVCLTLSLALDPFFITKVKTLINGTAVPPNACIEGYIVKATILAQSFFVHFTGEVQEFTES